METRYGLYLRKSDESEDRQVNSREDQETEMTKLAQKRGLSILKVYSEARSAKTPGRPVFNEMLVDLHCGRINGILSWRFNRLARNPIDGGQIIWMLQQNRIHSIVTIEGDALPTDNMIMLYLRFGMASQFSLDLGVDTKRGLESKVANGWMPRKAPPGYVNDRHGLKGEKKIYVDPDQFELIQEVWRELLTNKTSLRELWLYAQKIGVKGYNGTKIPYGTFYRLLHNPFYAGKFCWRLTYVTGSHQPMITWQEFEEAQRILGEKKTTRLQTYYKHQFEYRGMIRCGECGAMITAERHTKTTKAGKTATFTYYRCTKRIDPECSQRALRDKNLQVQMEKILIKRGIMSSMKEGEVELRLTNGQVRVVTLTSKPFAVRSHLDRGLNSINSLFRLMRGVVNGR